jgi:toxin ParE1/3/4
MKVQWSAQALRRLEDIEDYFTAKDPLAAQRLIARLIRRGNSLSSFPRRGRIVPELKFSWLRELIDGNYRIVYRLLGSVVQIVTVFESHRLPPWEDLA